MSYDLITQAFVRQFDTALQQVAQQTESRLQSHVRDIGSVTGESFTHNIMGDTDLDAKLNRLAPTVLSSVVHATPTALMQDFFKALPLDRADVPKMLINPVTGGDYMRALMSAKNRRIDQIIYAAMLGTQTFKDGSTEALPAGQVILNGSTGFTKGKLIQAKKIFRANEADEHAGEELCIIYNDAMLEDILADTTLTSADYMSVKMLQDGDVNGKWMGFSWVPYNALSTAGNVASTVAWAKSAVKFGRGYEEGDVSKRPDLQNAWQVSMAASYGALRTEAKRVVKIDFVQ